MEQQFLFISHHTIEIFNNRDFIFFFCMFLFLTAERLWSDSSFLWISKSFHSHEHTNHSPAKQCQARNKRHTENEWNLSLSLMTVIELWCEAWRSSSLCLSTGECSFITAGVHDGGVFSRIFQILYRNEEVTLEDRLNFRVHLLLDGERVSIASGGFSSFA